MPRPTSGRRPSRRRRCLRTTACGARCRPIRERCRSSIPVVSTSGWGRFEYWKGGASGPVWFLADPRRTDLALIDPAALQDVTRFPWAVAGRPELAGSRPLGADWYRIARAWMVRRRRMGADAGDRRACAGDGGRPRSPPDRSWVRRRPGPLHLVVGGRHLGAAGDPAADFELSLDGSVRDRWTLTLEERNFLRFIDIPEGLPGTGYGRLTIASRSPDADSRRALVAVRQFDIQSADRMLVRIRRRVARGGTRSDDRPPLALDQRAIGHPHQRRHRRSAHHAQGRIASSLFRRSTERAHNCGEDESLRNSAPMTISTGRSLFRQTISRAPKARSRSKRSLSTFRDLPKALLTIAISGCAVYELHAYPVIP